MRKSELFKLCEDSHKKINELNLELEEIKAENVRLKSELENLKNSEKTEELHLKDEEKFKEIDVEQTVDYTISPETDYGAKVIGKIVVSATLRCNEISAREEISNSKELINLILGRTEVAKSEIMSIVSSDCEYSVKTEMIDREKEYAEDYFISVLGQM